MLTAWILLLAFFLLVLANALFVAVEFSFLTVDRAQVEKDAADGDRIARLADRSLRRTSTNLSGAQLGITVTSLVAGFLTGPSWAALFTEGLGLAGIPEAAAIGVATTAAFILATFTQMVFGELIPKNWALAASMRVVRLCVVPQQLFMWGFGWLVWLLNGSANAVLRAMGFTPAEEPENTRSGTELLSSVNRSRRVGSLDERTANLVAQSIEFGHLTAADAMLPRPLVQFVHGHSAAAVLQLVTETGHSRFPVLGESLDDVVGVVHYRHVLALPPEKRDQTPAADLAVDLPVVSESMTLDPLLRVLRESQLQMALVVDEYGGTAGIVTLEDLLEEIVGEIDDEQDGRSVQYDTGTDGSVTVSGLLRPDELGDILEMDLPEGKETATLTGLLSERLDRLPEPGDTITVRAFDLANRDKDDLPTHAAVRLQVETVESNRIEQLRALALRGDEYAAAVTEDPDLAEAEGQ